jgi:DNA-binding CsgD family transcriptional regulator
VLASEIHFPKRNTRDSVTVNKYKKQLQWRQKKVHELLAKGYSQKEISSTLHIGQPLVSGDISFIKNDFHSKYSLMNTKIEFATDYSMAQLSFDEIKEKFMTNC